MKSIKSFIPKTVFIAILLFNACNFVYAQKQSEVEAAQGADSRIKFAGSKEDMLLFDVQLDNLPAKGVILRILNEFGEPIYTERISAAFHNCRYKIILNNMEKITFTVSGKGIYYDQTFIISMKSEERLEVSEINY